MKPNSPTKSFNEINLDSWNADYFTKSNGVTKSINDPYNYETFTLKNGLQVFLIENPSSNMSAAALNVRVGSKLDPPEFPGLAHYCEHALFLGSQQYPQADYLGEFLSNNGGDQNAHTAWDHTTYYFSVERNSFSHALQVWSYNFQAPLFETTSLEKEVSAVDSEHKKNMRDDMWRLLRSISCAIREDHPLHHFNGGNAQTLLQSKLGGIVGLKKALLDFYQNHYSSEKMTLMIYHHQLSSIRTLIQTEFGKIKRNNLTQTVTLCPNVVNTEVKRETLSYEGKGSQFWKRVPQRGTPGRDLIQVPVTVYEKVGTKNVLNVLVPCPNLNYGRKNNQFSYGEALLTSLITHPHPGGLRDTLKNQELIHGLNLDRILETDNLVILSLSFTLSPGAQPALILEYLYHYLEKLGKVKIEEIRSIHEESLRLQRLKFLDLCLPEGSEFAQSLLHCLNTTQVDLPNLLAYNMEPCSLETTFEHFQRLLEHFQPERWHLITTCDPRTGFTPNTSTASGNKFVWPTKETYYEMGFFEGIIVFKTTSNPWGSTEPRLLPEPNPYLPKIIKYDLPPSNPNPYNLTFTNFNNSISLNNPNNFSPLERIPRPIPVQIPETQYGKVMSVYWDGYNNYHNLSGFGRFKITNQAISPRTQVAMTLYINYLGERHLEHFLRINQINKIEITFQGNALIINGVFLSPEVLKGAFEILLSGLKFGYSFNKEAWQTGILKETEHLSAVLEGSPFQQTEEILQREIFPEHCLSLKERLELVQSMLEISGEEIHQLVLPFWQLHESFDIKGYFTGNVSQSDAESITQTFSQELETRFGQQQQQMGSDRLEPYLENYHNLLCLRRKGPVSKKIICVNPQTDEKNSVLRYSLYLDTLENGVTNENELLTAMACTTILGTIFQYHYHEQLRGQQELGYNLGCSPVPLNLHSYRRETYLSFFIQSPVAKSTRLIQETEAFLDRMVQHLLYMPPPVFYQMKQSIANRFREPEKNVNIHLEKQFHFLTGTPPNSTPDWDRSLKIAQALEQLSHTTLVNYFHKRWIERRETIICGLDTAR